MNNPVIVIGYRGNMGKRYTKILDHLDVPWWGIEDMGVVWDNVRKEYASTLNTNPYHSVILATPTNTHMRMIKQYKTLNLPILCEKPVSFHMEDITWLMNNKINIKMVNQYAYLSGAGGSTYYDYYNSGMDGLQWDCINIIGLAGESRATVSNDSVKWKCSINGNKLSLEDVNESYIKMIKSWVDNPKADLKYIKLAHKRVTEGDYETSFNRDTGKVNKQKTSGQSEHEDIRQADGGQSDISGDENSIVRGGSKLKPSKRGASGAKRRQAKRPDVSSTGN